MLGQTVFLVLTALLLPGCSDGATKSDYYNLYDSLFESTNYRKEVRPSPDENSTMLVTVVMYLLSIVEVDEKHQTLKTSARLQMMWNDNWLMWTPVNFGGIKTVLVPQGKMYLPDVMVKNSVTSQGKLGYDELPVRINSTGSIIWDPIVLLFSSCDIDITYFPFDTQTCYIEFETAVSWETEVDIKLDTETDTVNLFFFGKNGQWEITNTGASLLSQNGAPKAVNFRLVLKRRRTFYLLNIILPIFFLSLTSSLVFALPADEGEKMGTGITLLLSFTVYLTVVSDLVPNTSLQVSILGLYLTLLIGWSALSLCVCVAILRIHHRDEDDPIGPRTVSVISFLRTILFMTKKHSETARNKVRPLESPKTEISEELQSMSHTSLENNKPSPTTTTTTTTTPDTGSTIYLKKDNMTWKDVAQTLDIFCFLLFSFISVFFTVGCILALSYGASLSV